MCIRDRIHLFGVTTSFAGLVFGFSLTLFNSFFNVYMEKVFPEIGKEKWDGFKSNLNTTFAFGGILCTLGSSYVMHLFGRRTINLGLGILNLLASMMLLIPHKGAVLVARFISGKT